MCVAPPERTCKTGHSSHCWCSLNLDLSSVVASTTTSPPSSARSLLATLLLPVAWSLLSSLPHFLIQSLRPWRRLLLVMMAMMILSVPPPHLPRACASPVSAATLRYPHDRPVPIHYMCLLTTGCYGYLSDQRRCRSLLPTPPLLHRGNQPTRSPPPPLGAEAGLLTSWWRVCSNPGPYRRGCTDLQTLRLRHHHH